MTVELQAAVTTGPVQRLIVGFEPKPRHTLAWPGRA